LRQAQYRFMHSLRQPAPLSFLARRVAAIAWPEPLRPASRRWLVEICRAELEWERADWRRLGGIDPDGFGAHPCEAWRLPHEVAAARLVNCHLHVDGAAWRLRELGRWLPQQDRAATDAGQSQDYRADWAEAAARTKAEVTAYRGRLRRALRAFRSAASHYRQLRAAIDAALPAAHQLAA
jgi:hypothetical protein